MQRRATPGEAVLHGWRPAYYACARRSLNVSVPRLPSKRRWTPLSGYCTEVVLRIAAASDSERALRHFACELMPLVTAGPPGTTGYAAGRPRIDPVFATGPA